LEKQINIWANPILASSVSLAKIGVHANGSLANLVQKAKMQNWQVLPEKAQSFYTYKICVLYKK
jgi:hypothetical protein